MAKTIRALQVALSLCVLSLPLAARAQSSQNLGAFGHYADPEIHVFAGQFWIYPTRSIRADGPDVPTTFNTEQQHLRAAPQLRRAYLHQTSLDAFSSPDLVHWTRHDRILDVKDVPWAAYAVWAPSILHHAGKYWLFFAANDIQKHSTFPGGIGVAVSDHPGGPFHDALGHPLIGRFENDAQPIDPAVFEDTDGSFYLYFGGQGHCEVARLAPDMTHFLLLPDGSTFRDITPPGYVEGPFTLKRGATYYFMWSVGDWGDASYGVEYAKGSSPLGPFEPMGKILSGDPHIAFGAGHHSVLRLPGTDQWIIAYHRHPLGTTDANDRVLALDKLEFDAQGNILPVRMTADGPGVVRLPPGSRD